MSVKSSISLSDQQAEFARPSRGATPAAVPFCRTAWICFAKRPKPRSRKLPLFGSCSSSA